MNCIAGEFNECNDDRRQCNHRERVPIAIAVPAGGY